MQPPFIAGDVVEPPYFIDREAEIERMTRSLGMLAENVLVLGQRRMGKSSLIHNAGLRIRSEYPEVGLVYLDCRSVASPAELCEVLVRRVLEEYRDRRAVQGWLEVHESVLTDTIRGALTRVKEVGVKSVEDVFVAYVDFREDAASANELLRETFEFVDAFAEEKSMKYVVFFDELQELSNFGAAPFQLLKSSGEHARNVRFVYTGSAMRVLGRIFLRPDSPLYITAGKIHLAPLHRERVVDFVRERFRSAGVVVSAEAAATVHDRTGGIPFYVQRLGHLAYVRALEAQSTRVETEGVEAAFLGMVRELGGEFEARFEYKFGPVQKRILVALARRSPRRRVELARAVGRPTEAISTELRRLEEAMEIEKLAAGVYRVSDPVFAAWLAGSGIRGPPRRRVERKPRRERPRKASGKRSSGARV